MYQGSRELDEENAEPFGFDAASIDYVLLTHAISIIVDVCLY